MAGNTKLNIHISVVIVNVSNGEIPKIENTYTAIDPLITKSKSDNIGTIELIK